MSEKRLAKWYTAANSRRAELIRTRNRSPVEEAELRELQERVRKEVNRVHPGPPLGRITRQLREIETRYKGKR